MYILSHNVIHSWIILRRPCFVFGNTSWWACPEISVVGVRLQRVPLMQCCVCCGNILQNSACITVLGSLSKIMAMIWPSFRRPTVFQPYFLSGIRYFRCYKFGQQANLYWDIRNYLTGENYVQRYVKLYSYEPCYNICVTYNGVYRILESL